MKEYFDHLAQDDDARPCPVPLAGRRASGSQAHRGAGRQHVPRSAHPRIRDPEVRRRPRATGRLRPADIRAGRCEGCRHPGGLPEPGRAALVHRRDLPQPDAPPRDRIAGRPRAMRKPSTVGSWCSHEDPDDRHGRVHRLRHGRCPSGLRSRGDGHRYRLLPSRMALRWCELASRQRSRATFAT